MPLKIAVKVFSPVKARVLNWCNFNGERIAHLTCIYP